MPTMANSRPPSIDTADVPDPKPSFFHNVSAKASHYHARVPYLQKLPFPAIAIIATLIVVNLLVWAAVGIVLVCLTTSVTRAAG
jgi:high-affinity nickel-transport protein